MQLKEIAAATGTVELKAKAMDHLLMAHALRHENINPLIGMCSFHISMILSRFCTD